MPLIKAGKSTDRLSGDIEWRYERPKKNAWRTFCNSINNLHMSVMLHRAFSREPKIKLGSLVAPLVWHTQSEEETLEFLLVTHFPYSVVRE